MLDALKNPYILLMIAIAFIASFSQILLKISAGKKHESVIKEYVNPFVIGGYAMLVVSMFLGIICYKHMDYMQVVILEPVGYIIVMFLSRIFFKEKITRRKITGMLFILLGIIIFHLVTPA